MYSLSRMNISTLKVCLFLICLVILDGCKSYFDFVFSDVPFTSSQKIMNKLPLFSVISSLFLTTSSLFPAVTKADSYTKYGDAGILRVSCYKQSSDSTAYPEFLIDTRNFGSTMIVAVQGFYWYDGLPNRPYIDFSTGTNYYLSDHSITAEGINTFSTPISAQGYLPNGAFVTLEEADPRALLAYCDNRPTPIDDPGGGGPGGGGPGGGGDPCPSGNSGCCSCTALRYGDDDAVAAEGTIDFNPASSSVQETPQQLSQEDYAVNLGQWNKASYVDPM